MDYPLIFLKIMTTKICTSVKQSKKLLELGIDVNTADMYWDYDVQKHEHYPMVIDNQFDDTCICAWSLAALLELMPTDDKKDEYYVDTESHSDYHTVNYRNCWDGCVHSEYSEESLLGAAFKMVCWLKENNKL